jgi:mannobiose 2-epimerase
LALQWALEIYSLIEKYANDRKFGGYTEAFARDWSNIDDMRLSEKDANEAKTMNTHLHVLEAYTNLYRVHREKALESQLRFLIEKFLITFYDKKTKHFNLFFNEQWQVKGQIISYGHDIEAAWLLIEAAKVIQDKNLIILTGEAALQIADAFMDEALGKDGGVCNEFNPETGILDTDKHWWPQVEAIIGLNYAWQLSKEEKYLACASSIWDFTKNSIIDKINGEWHWRVNSKGEPNTTDYKMGMWKAPYHNSRACIQMNR